MSSIETGVCFDLKSYREPWESFPCSPVRKSKLYPGCLFPSSLAEPFIAGTILNTCKTGPTLHGSEWHFSDQPSKSTFPKWDGLTSPRFSILILANDSCISGGWTPFPRSLHRVYHILSCPSHTAHKPTFVPLVHAAQASRSCFIWSLILPVWLWCFSYGELMGWTSRIPGILRWTLRGYTFEG